MVVGLMVGLIVSLLMAVTFHSLAHSRKTDGDDAKRAVPVLMFPRDPLLMAILCDLAVVIVTVLLLLRLFQPGVLAVIE